MKIVASIWEFLFENEGIDLLYFVEKQLKY